MEKKSEIKVLISNRKAFFNYEIFEKFEAGIVLTGTEIKSVRLGKASLTDSFAFAKAGELFLYEMNIPEYDQGNRFNHLPKRPRKLLMHKHEIKRLIGKVREKGLSLVPLRLYLKKSKAKIELGLGRGRKTYDKRELIKNRVLDRETSRTMKEKR
ncbi:MAG: SsrA-binding protein SmpB [Candidatus Wallbacteria bacterium]|nr:SsrA-binding protein SmpB [Candidatus Wallbacteria bacterium]